MTTFKKAEEAYYFVRENPNLSKEDFKKYQKIACKSYIEAYFFALNIKGADIEYCQKYAFTDFECLFLFVEDIVEAKLEIKHLIR